MKDVLNSKSIKVCSMRFQEKFVKCIINCYDRRLSATKIRCKQSARSSPMVTWFLLLITFKIRIYEVVL